MIRTRVGYAGGNKANPTYHDLGDNSETIQIDYDPEVVSYETLLDAFWRGNDAVNSPFSKQYHSIIFYHNEEQKNKALESYNKRRAEIPNTVNTEIVPYSGFTPAELYHQKYYLQLEQRLMKDVLKNAGDYEGFMDSTIAARLNGYVGGYGDIELLHKEIDSYGLSEEGKAILLDITKKGLRLACPVPVD